MYYDKLEKQRRAIIRERKFTIFFMATEVMLSSLLLWATLKNAICLLIFWLPILALLFSVRTLMKENRLLRQFSDIVKHDRIQKNDEKTLYRPKVGFLVRSEFSTYHSALRYLYGITLQDHDKKKYYCFFDEPIRHTKETFETIQEKCYRELHIQCYENTLIIRTIENDPYFLRIRLESFYK